METSHDLSIAVEEWRQWRILALKGKFVVKSLAPVRKRFDEIESGKCYHVAVDLSGVSHIDSSALTIVLNFQKRFKQNNGEVVVIGPSKEINETLCLVGFNLAVPIYGSRALFEKSVAD